MWNFDCRDQVNDFQGTWTDQRFENCRRDCTLERSPSTPAVLEEIESVDICYRVVRTRRSITPRKEERLAGITSENTKQPEKVGPEV